MCGKCGLINGKCLFFSAVFAECDTGWLCFFRLNFLTFLEVLLPSVLTWIKIFTYQKHSH